MMPSLLRYFAVVGGILFAGLIGLNAVLEPGGPGPRLVKDTPKAAPIRHDPRASLVERLRAEEAAQAAAKAAEMPPPVTVAAPAAPAPQPVTQAAAQPAAQPVKQAAAQPAPQPVIQAAAPPAPEVSAPPAPDVSTPAALAAAPVQDEAARAVRLAKEKDKAQAEKARKARLARERARARAIEEASARRQDQFYYGYAPQPSYGPFAQGQPFGGGWGQRW